MYGNDERLVDEELPADNFLSADEERVVNDNRIVVVTASAPAADDKAEDNRSVALDGTAGTLVLAGRRCGVASWLRWRISKPLPLRLATKSTQPGNKRSRREVCSADSCNSTRLSLLTNRSRYARRAASLRAACLPTMGWLM